jgi:hypothetical protein
MRLRSPFTVVLLGVLVMTAGVTTPIGPEIEIVTIVLGFVVTVSGLLLGVKETLAAPTKAEKESRDDPSMVRIIGVVIALISLGTPYVRTPLAPSTAGETSLIAFLSSLQAGAALEGAFILLVLMAIVIAGAFISLFHHVGGYVMLLGSMTFVFMTIRMLGSITQFQRGIHFGLYLSIFAAFVIISSSLIDPTTGLDADSDWATSIQD